MTPPPSSPADPPSTSAPAPPSGAPGRIPGQDLDQDQHRHIGAAIDPELVQRRVLRVVVLGQVLGGAGLAAGVTVGALLAQQMLGSEGAAGIPAALFTLGSAVAAYAVGRISQRRGRRIGLGAGFAAGGAGAVGVVVAVAIDNVPLLLLALLVYGAGTATNLQARYAGTDLAAPSARGRAISVALVSTTAGAVVGPNLVQPLGEVATTLHLPPLTGPFLLAAVAYAAAGASLFALLRPDPLLLARELEAHHPPTLGANKPPGDLPNPDPEAGLETGLSETTQLLTPPQEGRPASAAYLGAAVMVVTQLVMVAIMTMTPVHLRHYGHSLGAVGLVISLHIAAMYLPSPITGWLVDRTGRVTVAVASGVVLLAAGALAAWTPAQSLPYSVAALVLLGLGWNLGLISGTALVVDGTDLTIRSRTQGTIDVVVALAGAGGSITSGAVVAASSYQTLALGASALALLLLPALRWRDSLPATAATKGPR